MGDLHARSRTLEAVLQTGRTRRSLVSAAHHTRGRRVPMAPANRKAMARLQRTAHEMQFKDLHLQETVHKIMQATKDAVVGRVMAANDMALKYV